MLDIFRKRGLSSIVYGFIIIGMILVFVIQFRPNAGQQSASVKEACVVTVKGHCVNPKSFKAAYRILIPRDQGGNLMTAKAKTMGLGKIAADGLIERELLVDEADRIGLRATPDEVDQEIINGFIHVSVPSDNPQLAYSLRVGDGKVYAGFKDQKSKQFDYKVYERTVRMLVGRSPTEFKEEQERELLASKMRELVRAPVRVSEPEALELYVAEKSTAQVTYTPVRQSYVARYAVQATPAEIAEWRKDKANEELIATTLSSRKKDHLPLDKHIRHILVRAGSEASTEDKAIALAKLSQAAARIRAGEAFADVAREVSQDPGSAAKGGDVGDKTDGFVDQFKKAANDLKPGEMTSEAIETQFGYHLIEKDDPSKAAAVEEALKRGLARELYSKTKALDATKDLAAKIAADVKAGKSADDAIKAAIAPLVKAPADVVLLPVRAMTAKAGDAGADVTVTSAAGDAGAAPKAAPAKALTAETDPDRPQATTSSAFSKGGDPIPALTGDASSSVSKFAFSGKSGDVMAEPVRTEDGFLVVQLKELKTATKEEFDKTRDTYVETLLAAKQAEALGLYVKRLRDAAKSEIRTDESYLSEKTAGDGGVMPSQPDFDDEEQ